MNKKVKNATIVIIDDIEFKSKSEGKVYSALKEQGILASYEPKKFLLWSFKNDNYLWWQKGKDTHSKIYVKDITYTPDFIYTENNKTIIIEVKGKPNDVYPYKRKLFLNILDENTKFYEVDGNSKKQVNEMINNIKHFIK